MELGLGRRPHCCRCIGIQSCSQEALPRRLPDGDEEKESTLRRRSNTEMDSSDLSVLAAPCILLSFLTTLSLAARRESAACSSSRGIHGRHTEARAAARWLTERRMGGQRGKESSAVRSKGRRAGWQGKRRAGCALAGGDEGGRCTRGDGEATVGGIPNASNGYGGAKAWKSSSQSLSREHRSWGGRRGRPQR